MGLRFANGKQNLCMVNFIPEPCVSFAQMRSIYRKGACKSRKQVSKMSIEQIDGKFPFGTFCLEKTGLHVPFLHVLLLLKMYIQYQVAGSQTS